MEIKNKIKNYASPIVTELTIKFIGLSMQETNHFRQ